MRLIATLSLGIVIGAMGVLALTRPFWLLRSSRPYNDHRDYDVQWQFAYAAQHGLIDEMKRLHAGGARINDWPRDPPTEGGFPAIFVAACNGEAKAVEWLLENGADVNVVCATDTPLDCAESRLEDTRRTVEALRAHGGKRLGDK